MVFLEILLFLIEFDLLLIQVIRKGFTFWKTERVKKAYGRLTSKSILDILFRRVLVIFEISKFYFFPI